MSLYLGTSPIASTGYDKANTDLSNLTSTGKNIANWSNNVTNCITEIPQDIKLELNNGTLTLKAGSKVYVPNGVGVFNVVSIVSDITLTSLQNRIGLLYYYNGSIYTEDVNRVYSGATYTGGTYGLWYDTTNNRIGYTSDGGSSFSYNKSLPLAIITVTTSSVTSIDQVFNGFGYIGSTIFALPGVKGLIPNGRNDDGTLKNTAFTISNVSTNTYTTNGDYYFRVGNNYVGFYLTLTYYDEKENFIIYNEKHQSQIIAGNVKISDGKIASLTPKTAFHALDYNDSPTISGWSMPSSRYIDLTVGASGSTYTAPANGYFFCARTATAAGQILQVEGAGSGFEIWSQGSQRYSITVPVRKGQVVYLYYTMPTAGDFKFIYAQGDQ